MLSSSLVILFGCGSGLTFFKYRHIAKPCPISESFITEIMTYQNCGGRNDDLSIPTSNAKKATGMNVMSRIKRIINGNSKNMKQELQELKREYLYKNKAKQK